MTNETTNLWLKEHNERRAKAGLPPVPREAGTALFRQMLEALKDARHALRRIPEHLQDDGIMDADERVNEAIEAAEEQL